MMTKHAQNRKRFGRRNFKLRYFRLTTHSLSYSKSKGKRPICDIPLTELVAVERLEERSFKMQNIFKVSHGLPSGLASDVAPTHGSSDSTQ
jgi:Ras GTPase-activating protein 3